MPSLLGIDFPHPSIFSLFVLVAHFQEREGRPYHGAQPRADGQRRHLGHDEKDPRPQNWPNRSTRRRHVGPEQKTGRSQAGHRPQEEGHAVGQTILPGFEQQGQRSGATRQSRTRCFKAKGSPTSEHNLGICPMQLGKLIRTKKFLGHVRIINGSNKTEIFPCLFIS